MSDGAGVSLNRRIVVTSIAHLQLNIERFELPTALLITIAFVPALGVTPRAEASHPSLARAFERAGEGPERVRRHPIRVFRSLRDDEPNASATDCSGDARGG